MLNVPGLTNVCQFSDEVNELHFIESCSIENLREFVKFKNLRILSMPHDANVGCVDELCSFKIEKMFSQSRPLTKNFGRYPDDLYLRYIMTHWIITKIISTEKLK